MLKGIDCSFPIDFKGEPSPIITCNGGILNPSVQGHQQHRNNIKNRAILQLLQFKELEPSVISTIISVIVFPENTLKK